MILLLYLLFFCANVLTKADGNCKGQSGSVSEGQLILFKRALFAQANMYSFYTEAEVFICSFLTL
jgi:hypothetical protein